MLPSKRTAELHIEQLDGETVIYDQRTNAAHCLNALAAAVWREIDSHQTIESLTQSVASHVDSDTDVETVEAAMDALQTNGLLESATVATHHGVTRRDAAKAALTAGIALAFVTTVTAPAAAQTVSGGPPVESA